MVAKVLIKRTSTDNSPPAAGLLDPGELAIEMGNPTRMWVGVPTINDPGLKKLLYDSSVIGALAVTQCLIRPFTVSVLYTPTAGLLFAVVEVVAGGGGGGGSIGAAGSYYCGGGGGAGGYSRSTLTAAQIGASQPITIGAGGPGLVGDQPNGTATGGNTSFGTLVVANGGGGGFFSVASGFSVGGGGIGGAPGTGDVACPGAPGDKGWWSQVSAVRASGDGGSSIFGGGGRGVYQQNLVSVGTDGQNYGSGGAGGNTPNVATSSTGGKGSDGIAIITEYF